MRNTIFFAALCALFLSACGPYKVDPVKEDSNFRSEKILALDRYTHPLILADRVKVLNFTVEKNESGNPMVVLSLANRRSSNTMIDIRTIFKDAKDVPVYTSSWEPVVLSPNSTYTYKCSSISPDFADYQVQIRGLE